MEELKNHNWSLTLIFCLIFALLGFITGKVASNNRSGDGKFMVHQMDSGMKGHKMLKWKSGDDKNMGVTVEIGEDVKVMVDIDTTYEEGGKKVRRVEKRILKEE